MSDPAINQRVRYRSVAGDQWDAVVTGIPNPGHVAIRIDVADLELRSVRWYDAPGSAPGAFPKEGLSGEGQG